MSVLVTRRDNGPIIGPDLHPSIGVNIQGPWLIRVPDWIGDRLGAYYLYFAYHKRSYKFRDATSMAPQQSPTIPDERWPSDGHHHINRRSFTTNSAASARR
jgi:hypothetical protein